MASISKPKILADGTETYKVTWRTERRRGTPRTIRTVYSEQQAKDLKFLVDRNAQQTPTEAELRAFGLEFLCAAPVAPELEVEAAPDYSGLLTGDYCHDYVESVAELGTTQGRNLRNMRQYVRDYIRPVLGAIPLVALTPADIRMWQAALSQRGGAKGNGLASSTVNAARAKVLAPALKCACNPFNDRGLPAPLSANPIEFVTPLEDRPSFPDLLETDAEMALFVKLAYETWAERPGPRALGDISRGMFSGGYREQEAVALQCSAVRLSSRKLRIEAAMKWPEFGPWERREIPKTARSYREVPIAPSDLDFYARLVAGRPGDAPLFVGPTGGYWAYSTLLGRFNKVMSLLGSAHGVHRKMTVGKGRHVALQAMRRNKIDLEASAQIAGHTVRTSSRHYQGRLTAAEVDAFAAAQDATAAAMAAAA